MSQIAPRYVLDHLRRIGCTVRHRVYFPTDAEGLPLKQLPRHVLFERDLALGYDLPPEFQVMAYVAAPGGLYVAALTEVKTLRRIAGWGPLELASTNGKQVNLVRIAVGWVGFSHRAAVIFSVHPDSPALRCAIFEERLAFPHAFGDQTWEEKDADKIPFIYHGTRPVLTMDDAREAASNFAEYIG